MTDYYLRVSVKETNYKIDQYHWFATYDKDRKYQDILNWMLADTIRNYKLDSTSVIIEQFSKF